MRAPLQADLLQCSTSSEALLGLVKMHVMSLSRGPSPSTCLLQDVLPRYRQVTEAYFRAVTALGMRLLRLLALALDLPPQHFHPMFTRPMLFLRPLHYAPRRSRPDKARLPHLPASCLTEHHDTLQIWSRPAEGKAVMSTPTSALAGSSRCYLEQTPAATAS